MQCHQVRESLAAYQDKEYRCCNAKAIEDHLENCHSCREHLAGIAGLGHWLNQWEEDTAPENLVYDVMSSIKQLPKRHQAGNNRAGQRDMVSGGKMELAAASMTGPTLWFPAINTIFKDLALAAAVALTVLWLSGFLLQPLPAGYQRNVGTVTQGYIESYTRTVGYMAGFTSDMVREVVTGGGKLDELR